MRFWLLFLVLTYHRYACAIWAASLESYHHICAAFIDNRHFADLCHICSMCTDAHMLYSPHTHRQSLRKETRYKMAENTEAGRPKLKPRDCELKTNDGLPCQGGRRGERGWRVGGINKQDRETMRGCCLHQMRHEYVERKKGGHFRTYKKNKIQTEGQHVNKNPEKEKKSNFVWWIKHRNRKKRTSGQ